MLSRIKFIAVGFVFCVLLTSLFTIVFAEPLSRNITALYDNIRIQINGVVITPRDAQGNIIEPFTIDGTTYLPVRAVGEALGLKVDWNNSTKTVILEGNQSAGSTSVSGSTSVQGSTGVSESTSVSGSTNAQTIDSSQPAQNKSNTKVFEDSFLNNKPLDERWEKTGTWTFVEQYGLRATSGYLTLTEFLPNDAKNFTVEFEARMTETSLFGLYLKTDASGKRIGLFEAENTHSNSFEKWVGIYYHIDNRNTKLADFTFSKNVWYGVKIDVVNNQANIYIDNKLVVSQSLSPTNTQISFSGFNYFLKNVKVTLNE